jgi:hypothetical protein
MKKHVRQGLTAALMAGLVLSAGPAALGGGERDEAWVAQRVRQVRQSDTTAWKKIPWVASLLEARRLSRQEDRPVFLFTYDGNFDTGRC